MKPVNISQGQIIYSKMNLLCFVTIILFTSATGQFFEEDETVSNIEIAL